MWRDRSDANPSIEELPFAPQSGIWWHGRCHWVCYPFGVGSWAPGEAPQFALPDLTLFSVRDGGADLLLGPRHRTPQGTPERKLITQGFRWQPGQTPSPDPLGPYGVASTRTTSGEWSAIAHPEADRVRIEHADGRAWSLICYYPFGVAWTGRSLLVGTTEGELLLFERLMDNLEAIA